MKNLKKISIIVITVFVSALATLSFAETWVGPTGTAPNNNAPVPINVTGYSQAKSGGLMVGSLFSNGAVKIGGTSANCSEAIAGAVKFNDSLGKLESCEKIGSDWNWSQLSKFVNGSNLNNAVYMDGNVGIGTTSPSKKLDVAGDINLTGKLYKNGVLFNGAGKFVDGNNADDAVYMDGNVGIGTTSPLEKLHVVGNVKADSFIYNSDIRLKKDIKRLENYRDILKIDAVRFNWKKDGKADVGIIAQEVQKYFPEFVYQSGDYLAVDYPKLAVPMINLLQEQEERLNKQEKEIQELKKIIKGLRK